MLLYGLLEPGRYYQFPFFAAGIFTSFILPQLPGLINNPFMGEATLNRALFFSFLCLLMCWVGWELAVRRQGYARPSVAFSENRLLVAACALTLVGAYFFWRFGQLPDEERLRGILTGRAVAYMFFAKLLTYGFAIGLLCLTNRPSRLAWAVILVCTAFYLERIIIAGRRGETAEFILLITLALWFQKGWAVPRSSVVIGLLFSIVGMLAAGQYREATYYTEEPDWSSVLNIDLAENWNQLLQNGGAEMGNAAMAMDFINRQRRFDFGLNHWNSTVFAYVPAQIVGQSLKDSLMVDVPPTYERGYQPLVGSTPTGMTDAFASFWYFGCVKFLLIGWAMGRIYSAARRGSTVMQLVYMLSAVPSMLTITHFTNEIVIAWIHLAAFMIPVLIYAQLQENRVAQQLTLRAGSAQT
jgi:hypothetical protein